MMQTKTKKQAEKSFDYKIERVKVMLDMLILKNRYLEIKGK